MTESTEHLSIATQSPRRFQRLQRIGVFILVCWHLLFLFFSNTTISGTWTQATFGRYETYAGLDQSWGMFSSPLWRTLPFPAARIHFADGTSDVFHSPNEPRDFTSFFRIGSTRQRKLEHYLITRDLSDSYQAPMQRRLAQWYAHQWRVRHPVDVRKPVRVTLLRLDYEIPEPGEKWSATPQAAEREVVTFDLENE